MDERTLNDLLECSICLEMLGSSSKVLPCQHTFCRKCLEVIVSSHLELRCPECRVLVDIKVEDLPPNVLLMRILEGMKNATSTGESQTNNSSSMAKPTTNPANDNSPSERQQPQRLPPIAHTTTATTTSTTSTTTSTIVTTIPMQPPLQPSLPNPSNSTDGTCQSNSQTNSSKSPGDFHPIRSNDETSNLHHSRQSSIPATSQCHGTNKQQVLPSEATVLPYARALYDFVSNEAGDLNFKKGDKIVLHRRIDMNWLIGECNGREGAFPVNYVQMITPMPFPQCKALYDFRMGPNEEEGCLAFKKGAIINVFRRVDQNWAEGRIGDCIGIFPIAFVEMNALAKQVMDLSAKYIHYALSARSVPPTPAQQSAPQQCTESTESNPMVTTSPTNPCANSSNSSSSSSTAPSSPISHQQSTTVSAATHANGAADAKREKRYSLNVLNSSANSVAHVSNRSQNRHSVELLAVAPVVSASNEVAPKAPAKGQRYSSKTTVAHDDALSATVKPAVNNSNAVNQYRHLHNSPASSTATHSFVALYPYRPQKSDELELKKGSVYYVTERCQDGWFKGTNRAHKSGVFPGNYVAPLRNSRSSNDGTHHAIGPATVTSSSHTKRSATHFGASANGSTQAISHRNGNEFELNNGPPELPPRSSVSGVATSSSVWSKPLGQHVEAFFGRKSNSASTTAPTQSKIDTSGQSTGMSKKDANASSTPSSTTANLIKRFTNMKRSKSPVNSPASAYSMDNPVFEDIAGVTAPPNLPSNKRNTIHMSHPVHVRSGSCPSQLLQSLPVDINVASSSNCMSASTNKNGDTSAYPSYMFGSQRIKGHKERPTLLGMRSNFDSNRHRNDASSGHANAAHQPSHHRQQCNKNSHHSSAMNSSSSSHHRKSQSLDTVTISAQIAPNSSALQSGAGSKNKLGSGHKEKFRCIVPYPPNSEFELELQLGDIVWVHKKRDNGWYKGAHARTGKVGLFPSSFVEPDI